MLLPTKTFPDQALDCIALDCPAYLLFGNRKSQSWILTRRVANKDCQVSITKAFIFLKYLLKISGTNQPQLAVKRLATGR